LKTGSDNFIAKEATVSEHIKTDECPVTELGPE